MVYLISRKLINLLNYFTLLSQPFKMHIYNKHVINTAKDINNTRKGKEETQRSGLRVYRSSL